MIELMLVVIGWTIMAMYRTAYGTRLSPDGMFYAMRKMDGGHYSASVDLPLPYSLRPLLVELLTTERAWILTSWASIAAVAVVSYKWFCLCLTTEQSITAVLLLFTFSHITRLTAIFPVLIDSASIAATFLVVYLWNMAVTPIDYLIASCTSLLLALMNEKIAVFAAVWSWSLMPLIGLFVTMIRYLQTTHQGKTGIKWLDNPMQEAITTHVQRIKNGTWWHAWGILPLAVFFAGWTGLAAVVIACAQLLRSQDYARLVLWCAPVLIIPILTHTPNELLLPLVVFNYLITSCDESV